MINAAQPAKDIQAERKRKALEDSIKHWEEDVLPKAGENGLLSLADIGMRACALCAEYAILDCNGCPVAEATGLPGCKGSPYRSVYKQVYWKYNCLPQVKAEIAFLKSLREEEGGES